MVSGRQETKHTTVVCAVLQVLADDRHP